MLIDFRERGREGKREGRKHQCERETLINRSMLFVHALTSDGTHDLSMCPSASLRFTGGRSNQLSHTSQGHLLTHLIFIIRLEIITIFISILQIR